MDIINSYDILIALIKAQQDDLSNQDDHFVKGPAGFEGEMGAPHYLLGQCVRQLWNRKGHVCVSKAAIDLWNRLKVGESIFKYHYQKPVFYKNEEPVPTKIYVGAKSIPDWEGDVQFTKKGDCFRFRQVFHSEHIVPIGVILGQLLELDLSEPREEVYKKLDSIVDKIYVCYMTKGEDRHLNKHAKTKRSDDYLQVINTDYKDAGIEIAEWRDW